MAESQDGRIAAWQDCNILNAGFPMMKSCNGEILQFDSGEHLT